MCVAAHWAAVVACMVKPGFSLFSSVLSQWLTPWTWTLWSTRWEDGRRTRSSSPAPTASACHLRQVRPTWRRKESTSSSWRVFSSTIISRSSHLFLSPKLENPNRTNLSLHSALQATDWHLRQVPLHLHSLWGMQTTTKVTGCQGNFDKVRLCTGVESDCFCVCSTRTYTVPDPPGLFDGHVWPMYLKHRKEMESNCDSIGKRSQLHLPAAKKKNPPPNVTSNVSQDVTAFDALDALLRVPQWDGV